MIRAFFKVLLVIACWTLVWQVRQGACAEAPAASARASTEESATDSSAATALDEVPTSDLHLYVLPEADVLEGPPQSFVDLDHYHSADSYGSPVDNWRWQVLPAGLVYRSYLASTKEPRLGAQVVNASDWGWVLDGILGARVGLLRYGTTDPIWPDGFEIQAEGAAQLRLDIPHDVDLGSVDFRAGMPIVFGVGPVRTKLGYYHLSSHVGDEFLLRHPDFDRLNYARDCLMLGHSLNITPWWRLYAEADWAFYSDVGDPWEFQFGADYEAPGPTGLHGAPFFGINGHLRQELDFNGALTVQAGWSWRNPGGQLLRMGLQYYNGATNQLSFYRENEEQIGFGLWYDF